MKLYTYWRSSSAYRVRIALNLKGVEYESVPVHLVKDGGQQKSAEYLKINPQGLVPALIDGESVLRQSLAIIEYLDEKYPQPPLLPETAGARARVRGLAYLIADEIQPMNNLGVVQYLKHEAGLKQQQLDDWYRHWIARGFSALEQLLSASDQTGQFCHGETPGLADCCLVPQLYNARRYDCDLTAYPTITRIEKNCSRSSAFQKAAPENQPDAE
ncbi:MAG: maleylacetoacetate isomerase [Gammaproteobacteria bacterium]|nr:maleylacetoacetate isomerase [Gammaproteobacteria bacterium]